MSFRRRQVPLLVWIGFTALALESPLSGAIPGAPTPGAPPSPEAPAALNAPGPQNPDVLLLITTSMSGELGACG